MQDGEGDAGVSAGEDVCGRMLTYADVCRMVKEMQESAQEKTYADVC